VFGAGAVGGHVAARLAKGGADVSVVARGPHLAALQANGLTVHAPDGVISVRVRASADPAELGVQDAVLVSVKAPALPAAAAALAPLLGPETPVAFLLNGIPWWYFHQEGGPHDGARMASLDPGGVVWDTVGPERVIGGVVYSSCTVTAPGVVEVENADGRVVLGEPDGSDSPRVRALAAAIAAGGLDCPVDMRIRDRVWAKLALNLGSGPMAVLTQSPGRDVFAEEACRLANRAIAAETTAVAAAMGVEIRPNPDGQSAAGQKSGHLQSILQDLLAGRPMEVDAIYGAPLELARLAGVATPTLDLLVALVRVRARAAGLYGG
jgi:2-dehydropantoate 2-reductase